MTPGVYNLALYRGDTYRWQFLLWADVAKTEPADLTDVTVKAEIRDKPGGAIITPLPCTITAPNIIDAVLSSAACQALDAKGSWDLQLTYASGDVATVLAGAVTVTADVTDSTETVVVLMPTTHRMGSST
jgi:hypothetical protein